MWDSVTHAISDALGLSTQGPDRTAGQVVLRSAVVFCVALVLTRVANRRFMAKWSAFDLVLAFMLGSMLSRAINGSAAFFPTLAGGLALVVMHWLVSALSYYWRPFGRLAEGQAVTIVRDGRPVADKLRKAHMDDDDLQSSLREVAQLTSVEDVELAVLETNGKVSIIPRRRGVKFIDVPVQDGVKTVRIEFNDRLAAPSALRAAQAD